ncbi:hypothetical protein L1987_33502 [Smallanthus sonchifolius]|uniref:Uncharacterized protein n=1 Tax=Smallanthus sonchifolius TaxID=185202 RepID=A0ACB9HRX1_9ASTR|nr:hypothetical protein L1987_33502 [Smallanthus sonchifolius]
MCIDFKNLNQACPKDCYPPSKIDAKIDSLIPYLLKCFLDAYKGYHQIRMAREDQDKTAFYTDAGIFCYTKMPFGLKNAGATYQMFMDSLFKDQIGRNLEVYVDDLGGRGKVPRGSGDKGGHPGQFIKSKSHSRNEVSFHGTRGAEVERKAGGIKQVFIPSGRQNITFHGNTQASYKKEQFQMDGGGGRSSPVNEKAHMSAPDTSNTIERENPNHLLDTQRTGRKVLSHRKIGTCPDICLHTAEEIFPSTPHLELEDHTIEYAPRTAIKGHVLADFVTETHEEAENSMDETKEEGEKTGEKEGGTWRLFTEGSSNEEGCGAGLILTSPEDIELTYALRLEFQATNNEAEYEALIAGLKMADRMKAKHLEAPVDSLQVANQVNRVYEAKEETMVRYLQKTQELRKSFMSSTIVHIPRTQNKKADILSKLASTTFQHLEKGFKVEILDTPSIFAKEIMVTQM